MAFGDEPVLFLPRVHEHEIGITAAAQLERLPAADAEDVHVDPGPLRPRLEQVAKQSRVARARRRGESQRATGRALLAAPDGEEEEEKTKKGARPAHGSG